MGRAKPSASLSFIPLPPNLYTTRAFPVRQAALSPDGAQLLVAGTRGFALFALMQRRWRLLCSERQETQVRVGTLPLGWYTNDIFFVSTPASSPYGAAASAAAAAAAPPEPRSTLGYPEEAPRWHLPAKVLRRFEIAFASAVDVCPSRFGAHVPMTIHEKTAWLQQQQLQQQFSSRLWMAAVAGSGSSELPSVSTAEKAYKVSTNSSSNNMWRYSVLFLSTNERLDLRHRVAEIQRLPARPQTSTVLPRLEQQPLLRPTVTHGSRCCICHAESSNSGSCCIICSGSAALALRCLAAGNTAEPLLAIYDALGILTAYQLQCPANLQQQQQHRHYDVVALWQLDLTDFCDRPPQQIRFVGCAWLLLLLVQSGDLLLLRLSMPGTGHVHHHRTHHIPQLTVEASAMIAEGVAGLWVGAEAQLRHHFLLPSARLCVLPSRQQNHKNQRQQRVQEEAEHTAEGMTACCCTCSDSLRLPAQAAKHAEQKREVLQEDQDEHASYSPTSVEKHSSIDSTHLGLASVPVDGLPKTRATRWSSRKCAKVADSEAVNALEWPLTTVKHRGKSSVPHPETCYTKETAVISTVAPEYCSASRRRVLSSPAVHLGPLLERLVVFPRPAAAIPLVSACGTGSSSHGVRRQQKPEQEHLMHLVREGYAPLSLPVLAAEQPCRTAAATDKAGKAAGSALKGSGGSSAANTKGQHPRSRPKIFWAAGRRQLSDDFEKKFKTRCRLGLRFFHPKLFGPPDKQFALLHVQSLQRPR